MTDRQKALKIRMKLFELEDQILSKSIEEIRAQADKLAMKLFEISRLIKEGPDPLKTGMQQVNEWALTLNRRQLTSDDLTQLRLDVKEVHEANRTLSM